jgi:hypothetical protein
MVGWTSLFGRAVGIVKGKILEWAMKKRWLVISNCQTTGLGNSLSLLCPDVDVVTCDIWRFQAEADHWKREVGGFDHLIVNPEIQALGVVDFYGFPAVTWIPSFNFRGFHPDMSNVFCNGVSVKSPMDDYHSVLVFAAFKNGLSEAQARQLFSVDVYEQVGFFGIWESEKKALVARFEELGLDIRFDFVRWMRDGGFMHSMNHPRINAVYDLAEKIAKRLQSGVTTDTGIKPHDNLMAGPIYPIYPEVAERYGVGGGSYSFKPAGSYRVLSLEQFIDGCYRVYFDFNRDDLKANNPHYDVVATYIAETV